MKNMKKAAFWLCIIICVAGIGYIIGQRVKKEKNAGVYEKVREESRVNEEEPEKEPEEEKEEIPIDFAALKEINPDIYAWINIPGTNIDYPIVQSADDDSYYLNHTIEGAEGYPGSIYTERINAKDFTDFNTVIYGHDMKDGTMFKDLHKYEDAEFFDANNIVHIYTETEHLTYQIFAAVVYDDRHLMYSFDNTNVEDRQDFLQSVYEARDMRNQIRSDVQVNEESHVITMSTCIGGEPEKRFLVEAVRTDE